jgi:endonuclease/exonuclease/phosphatase (EEP) superfamily protein YafD
VHLGGTLLTVIAWFAVAITGLVVLTQTVGRPVTRMIAVIQSLAPYLFATMGLVTVAALVAHRPALGVVAGAVGLGGVLVVVRPVVGRAGSASTLQSDGLLRVGAVNLLYTNDRVDDVAAELSSRRLDVIVFIEYTAPHQATLLSGELAAAYPFRVERTGRLASGTAVWSRFPLTTGDDPATFNATIDVIVHCSHDRVRVVAVHPPTPIHDADRWAADIELVGAIGRKGESPTLVIGDFNATYWHPSFLRLLDQGYTDAHSALGKLWSSSWPTDSWLPAFVRLDHALTTPNLVPLAVEDFAVPGSDHRGFEVTVAPMR